MSACEACFDLNPGSEDGKLNWKLNITESYAFEHRLRFDFGQLKDAAEVCCSNCSIIRNGLRLIQDRYPLLKPVMDVEKMGDLILRKQCPLQVELRNLLRFDFFFKDGLCHNPDMKGFQRSAFGMAKDVYPGISIDSSTSIISGWIAECDEEHESCHKAMESQEHLPSRLLDIGDRDSDRIVLVEARTEASETTPSIARYATLSHCWGKTQLLQTKRDSLERHMQGIPLNVLPKTFQDSIRILKALGIKYMWIDSLCIVQDDDTDWKSESARMCDIYSHSYLNIAATSASNSTGGCLNRRSLKQNSLEFSTQAFPIIDEYGSAIWGVYVRPSFERTHNRYNKRFGSDPDPLDEEITPLLCRAWVFQERQLAPRTIHFHRSELIMECKTGLRCECTVLDRQQRRPIEHGTKQSQVDLKKYNTFAKWYELVKEYSQLSITHHSDRLIALLGVATQFQEKIECGFLAGIWDLDICQGLLWDVTRGVQIREKLNLTRAENPFAPSWSWASLIPRQNSPAPSIMFPLALTLVAHEKFAYLGTDIPKMANKWQSKVGTGYILIRALVVPATIYTEREGPDRPIATKLLFRSNPDQKLGCDARKRFRVNLDTTQHSVTSERCGDMNDHVIYCVIIATRLQSDKKETRKDIWLHVLLCRLCANKSNGVEYERVGVFDILEDEMPFECSEEMNMKLV